MVCVVCDYYISIVWGGLCDYYTSIVWCVVCGYYNSIVWCVVCDYYTSIVWGVVCDYYTSIVWGGLYVCLLHNLFRLHPVRVARWTLAVCLPSSQRVTHDSKHM